jgi:hypothetical protein
MNTDEIKKVLSLRFSTEKFSRTSKVKDDLGYTHRCFVSNKRNVVVTSDEDDEDITDVIEVKILPSSTDLKDGKRSWIDGGSLSNYYYFIKHHEDDVYLIVTDKYTFDTCGCLNDSHGQDLFIGSIILLSEKNVLISNAMESVYEVAGIEISVLENLLINLGAVRNPSFDW